MASVIKDGRDGRDGWRVLSADQKAELLRVAKVMRGRSLSSERVGVAE